MDFLCFFWVPCDMRTKNISAGRFRTSASPWCWWTKPPRKSNICCIRSLDISSLEFAPLLVVFAFSGEANSKLTFFPGSLDGIGFIRKLRKVGASWRQRRLFRHPSPDIVPFLFFLVPLFSTHQTNMFFFVLGEFNSSLDLTKRVLSLLHRFCLN